MDDLDTTLVVSLLNEVLFMQRHSPSFRLYEDWCSGLRDVFAGESRAVYGSSYALNAGLAAYGVYRIIVHGSVTEDPLGIVLVATAAAGAAGTYVVRRREGRRCAQVEAYGEHLRQALP